MPIASGITLSNLLVVTKWRGGTVWSSISFVLTISAKIAYFIASRAIMTMSRGVLKWPAASRPCGFTKFEFSSPRRSKCAFIIWANFIGSPARCIAMASAASFPEGINRPCSSCLRVRRSPRRKPINELPGRSAASTVEVTTSSRFPYSKACRAVMILVILAGGRGTSGSFSYRTCSVASSIVIAALARVSGGARYCICLTKC